MEPKLSLSLTPARFIALVERKRRWLELLMTAMFTRAELRNLDPKLADGNAVKCEGARADLHLESRPLCKAEAVNLGESGLRGN